MVNQTKAALGYRYYWVYDKITSLELSARLNLSPTYHIPTCTYYAHYACFDTAFSTICEVEKYLHYVNISVHHGWHLSSCSQKLFLYLRKTLAIHNVP